MGGLRVWDAGWRFGEGVGYCWAVGEGGLRGDLVIAVAGEGGDAREGGRVGRLMGLLLYFFYRFDLD